MMHTHPQLHRSHSIVRVFPILLLLVLTVAWMVFIGGTSNGAPDGSTQRLLHAEMAPGDAAEAARWQPVALPDTWVHHRLDSTGSARYRLNFPLSLAPVEVWALRADRLSTHSTVRVNGRLVHDTLRPADEMRPHPVPTLIALPVGLLQAGENLIEIEQRLGSRAGLSPLVAGPMSALESGFISGQHRSISLPQWLNVISIGACLVALLVWWRRPGELALGSFAMVGLLASLRNFAYYPVSSLLPRALSDWMFFVTQVATATLLGLFATALAETSNRRARRLWLLGGAALALAGSVAAAFDRLQQARVWLYPLLLLGLLLTLWQVALAMRRLPGRSMAILAAGLGLVFIAGVHDYFFQRGMFSVMDFFWMPFAVPVAVLGFTAMLVRRVVDGLHGVELANQVLEERVASRTTELELANAAKDRFVAAASHDLRQPVASIGLLVGLLREQVQAPPLRALIDRVDQGVASLEALLKGLLDLSRLDTGTLRPEAGPVPVQPLFDAIAVHESAAANAKGIGLRFRPTPLSVVSDAVLLEQMLRNLVNNAVRCTGRGGVLVAARRRGECVLLQVWDTGRGLTLAQQATAFEEFVQFDAQGRDGRGLGLGLALVRRNAQLLGHAVQVRSLPGRGSCFAIELPRERRASLRAAPPPPVLGRPLAGRRVLLVEDQPEVREALRLRLQHWGAEVRAYGDLSSLRAGHQAGDVASADLLLTDLSLPDGDGLELIGWMRERQAGLPALVVTATTVPAELERLARDGVPMLSKPFRAEVLLRAMQQLLAARPATDQAP